jgi:hypothetical protein
MNIRIELINLLKEDRLGLESIALTCDLIATDCRWNIWFAHNVKKDADEVQILEIIDRYDMFSTRCGEILNDFLEYNNEVRFEKNVAELTKEMNISMEIPVVRG